MKADSRFKTSFRWLLPVVVLITVAVLWVPLDAFAMERVPKLSWDNTVEAQGSFNYARRGDFRELYGNGITFAIRFEHRLGGKLGIGAHVSRVQMCKADSDDAVKLKYRDFAVTPMLTYTLVRSGQMRLFGGGGFGLSLRKIILETLIYDIVTGDPMYSVEFDQSEIRLRSLVMLGADLSLGGSVFLGARVTYDRHFLGDAELGDFGDTGGFNFGGSIGFGL